MAEVHNGHVDFLLSYRGNDKTEKHYIDRDLPGNQNLSPMASLSKLCGACYEALYAERASLATSQAIYDYKCHHRTLRSLASAVEQNCFVCCIVDEKVRNQAQDVPANTYIKEAASTMYRLRSKGDQGLQLVVIFLGEGVQVGTKFQLLPTGGTYTAV